MGIEDPHSHAHNHSPGSGWAQHAHAQLRAAGHNRGASRDALIEVFAAQGCACSAREIEQLINVGRRDGKPVGRSSIYRAIEQLHDLGLIVRVDPGDGVVRYEAIRTDHDHHHHHMLCERCGALIPFDDPTLETAIAAIASRNEFTVKEHDVTLRGLCAEC